MNRKEKVVTLDDVMRRMEKKRPGFIRAVETELEKLRLAERITAVRRKAHLSQKALAAKIGTTQSNVARMERASYKNYTLSTLIRIAHATGARFQFGFR